MSEQLNPMTDLVRNGKSYTAVVSFVDKCCDNAHQKVLFITALSSRDALHRAKSRCRRMGLMKTGEILIIRDKAIVTGIHSPKEHAHYMEDEDMWTPEETQNRSYL